MPLYGTPRLVARLAVRHAGFHLLRTVRSLNFVEEIGLVMKNEHLSESSWLVLLCVRVYDRVAVEDGLLSRVA